MSLIYHGIAALAACPGCDNNHDALAIFSNVNAGVAYANCPRHSRRVPASRFVVARASDARDKARAVGAVIREREREKQRRADAATLKAEVNGIA